MELPTTFTLGLILLIQTGCGLLGSDPNQPELEPGRRDYVWTVDSVGSTPDLWVGWGNSIWGSAPDDVWLALTGGYENLWHYNGTEWSPFEYRLGPDGFTGDFSAIYGFAQDDVWMAGRAGEGGGIWHFDGDQWKEVYIYKKLGMGATTFLDIWGESPKDIYAVGTMPSEYGETYKGVVIHYNGRRWEAVLVTDFDMQFNRIRKTEEGIFLYGTTPYLEDVDRRVKYYRIVGNKLVTVYNNTKKEAGFTSLSRIDNSVYFVTENKIMNSNFKSIIPFSFEEDVYGVNGRHRNDLFITTEFGVVHYNGDNTQYLLELESNHAVVFRTFIMENDVFFLVNDYENGTNLIYHGTLTETQQEE